MIVVYKTPSFCFVDRQVIAELLSIYENLNGTCETIVMIKGEYFTSNCNWNYAHIIIADRFKIQPYICAVIGHSVEDQRLCHVQT